MTQGEKLEDMDQLVRVRYKVVCHQHTADAECFGLRLGDQLGDVDREENWSED